MITKEFLEQLRERLSVVAVVGKSLALVKKGANYWACCPFHGEKTPSFSLNDSKGYYHCFGCGAHGDIISFAMQMQHLSFIEAVEKLCLDAGLEMPKFSADEKAKNELQHSMYEVVQLACEFFQKTLFEEEGKAGLDYFRGRQLSDEIIANFRLGYAPNTAFGETKLAKFLINKNIAEDTIIAAGLAGRNKEGKLYDYFRNRVMFPIQDSRGRVIAFGGRVMDDGEPKYLNSPETPIFSKGRGLYALCQARENVRDEMSPIACEGYMDTIALHKFGFKTGLAPLGTAITEFQIETLWKLHGEPILCFDSDTAGRNAGIRAALRALPIIKPGKSLRFCLIEGAKDPDEFLHAFGHDKFQEMLGRKTRALSDLLWEHFTSGRAVQTPEQRAGLEMDIEKELARIGDNFLRTKYTEDFKDRIRREFRNVKVLPKVTLPKANPENPNERMILAFAICYPTVFAKYLESGAAVAFHDKRFEKIFENVKAELLTRSHTRESMMEALHAKGFIPEKLLEFEVAAIIGKPDAAQKILEERLILLQRDNVTDEIKRLNMELFSTSDLEKTRGRIAALNEELAELDAKREAIE